MSSNNDELFNNLVGHVLGLRVRDAAILLKPCVKRPIKIDKTSTAM